MRKISTELDTSINRSRFFFLSVGIKQNKMEEKLIEAINDLLAKKQEILGHIEFCRGGLSEDYEYLFDNAERVVSEALAKKEA